MGIQEEVTVGGFNREVRGGKTPDHVDKFSIITLKNLHISVTDDTQHILLKTNRPIEKIKVR